MLELGWALELPTVMIYSETFVRLALAVVTLGAIPLVVLARLAVARARLRRLRRPFDGEVAAPDPSLEGRCVVLRGRVCRRGSVSGRPARFFTTTVEAARTARRVTRTEESLSLRVGPTDVILRGPVEVARGSRHVTLPPLPLCPRLRRALEEADPEARFVLGARLLRARRLRVGDEVVVRGVLRRLGGDGHLEAYRVAAARWVLYGVRGETGEEEHQALVAAFTGKREPTLGWLGYPVAAAAVSACFVTAAWLGTSALSTVAPVWW